MFRTLDKPFIMIAAKNQSNIIGSKGSIPWICPEDIAYFRKTTLHTDKINARNAVIMGSNTWASLSAPLKGRMNIIITRYRNNIPIHPDIMTFSLI